MHHRALRHLSPPSAISQWILGSTPSLTQALQAAANQAWARRVSSLTKASPYSGKHPILPGCRHLKRYGISGPICTTVSDGFVKRRSTR